jgi:hypothetical protein
MNILNKNEIEKLNNTLVSLHQISRRIFTTDKIVNVVKLAIIREICGESRIKRINADTFYVWSFVEFVRTLAKIKVISISPPDYEIQQFFEVVNRGRYNEPHKKCSHVFGIFCEIEPDDHYPGDSENENKIEQWDGQNVYF